MGKWRELPYTYFTGVENFLRLSYAKNITTNGDSSCYYKLRIASYLEMIKKFVTLLELLFLKHDQVHSIIWMLPVTVQTKPKIIEINRTQRWNRLYNTTTLQTKAIRVYPAGDWRNQLHPIRESFSYSDQNCRVSRALIQLWRFVLGVLWCDIYVIFITIVIE